MSQWGAGTVILQRYRLESLLGQGGMGAVWKAEHLQLKSSVAIKVLDPAVANSEQVLARFMREAQACASLRSPHVVQIFDYGVEEGVAFIAMELLQGESLSERIKRVGPLPPEETIRFLCEVLRAIAKAHEAGIVHRDLKPHNVFICRDDPEFAKVLDFGVAKIMNKDLGMSTSKTQTGMMIGTPYYMSPEQTQAKEIDGRSDLWSIAVIAFECLTGRRPFVGESFGELVIAICTNPTPLPSSVAPVPPGFDEWFVRGTQRDKARRFQDAREMAEELANILAPGVRPVITTGAMPRVRAFPTVRPNGPRTAPVTMTPAPATSDDLQLTTGQRAVVSSGEPSSVVQPSTRPAMYGLIGLAGVIVIGLAVFVGAGGASAFRAPAVESPPRESRAAAALNPSGPASPQPAAQPSKPATSASIAPSASVAPSSRPQPLTGPSARTPPARN